MEKNLEIKTCLSKEEIDTHIQIWEQASISIVDIRHDTLTTKHTISNYQLPSNIFFYTIGDSALVRLDEQTIGVERFGLFHASKGVHLSVQPVTTMEYYMVYYKIGAPLIHKKEFLKFMSSSNPFLLPYGFTPKDPIFFAKTATKNVYEVAKSRQGLIAFTKRYRSTRFCIVFMKSWNTKKFI